MHSAPDGDKRSDYNWRFGSFSQWIHRSRQASVLVVIDAGEALKFEQTVLAEALFICFFLPNIVS